MLVCSLFFFVFFLLTVDANNDLALTDIRYAQHNYIHYCLLSSSSRCFSLHPSYDLALFFVYCIFDTDRKGNVIKHHRMQKERKIDFSCEDLFLLFFLGSIDVVRECRTISITYGNSYLGIFHSVVFLFFFYIFSVRLFSFS